MIKFFYKYKIFKIHVVFLILIFILLLLNSCSKSSSTSKSLTSRYSIFFDSGSSGTRVYIYEITPSTNSQSLPILDQAPASTSLIQEKWSLKVTPGISTFASNLDGISGYLKPLIDFVKLKITNTSELAVTPTFLKATAGMRLLPNSDQQNIIAKAKDVLLQSSFYLNSNSSVELISGADEGLYSWIAVNYLSKSFDPGINSTYGIIELGGASLQITFVPEHPPLSDSKIVTLGKNTYNLYSKSYTGFGLNSARGSFNSNDCSYFSSTSPVFSTCKTSILTHFNTTCSTGQDSCGFNQEYQPPLFGDFYGLSNIYYVPNTNGVETSPLAISSLSSQGATVCSNLTISGSTACFDLAYLDALLTGTGIHQSDGFGFLPSTASKIYSIIYLQNREVNFTFGAAVLEASKN